MALKYEDYYSWMNLLTKLTPSFTCGTTTYYEYENMNILIHNYTYIYFGYYVDWKLPSQFVNKNCWRMADGRHLLFHRTDGGPAYFNVTGKKTYFVDGVELNDLEIQSLKSRCLLKKKLSSL